MSTWASPALSGDGGQGWHCPWCDEVNCSDHPETGRSCFKCKQWVDVMDEGDSPSGKDQWHVHPAPKSDSKLRELSKAHATGYPLQGRRKFRGLDLSIEQRKGGVRSGIDPDGHEWRMNRRSPSSPALTKFTNRNRI